MPTNRGGPSLEALASVAVAASFSYIAIEEIMNDSRHPLHWIITLVIAIIGYGVGQSIYRWKQRAKG